MIKDYWWLWLVLLGLFGACSILIFWLTEVKKDPILRTLKDVVLDYLWAETGSEEAKTAMEWIKLLAKTLEDWQMVYDQAIMLGTDDPLTILAQEKIGRLKDGWKKRLEVWGQRAVKLLVKGLSYLGNEFIQGINNWIKETKEWWQNNHKDVLKNFGDAAFFLCNLLAVICLVMCLWALMRWSITPEWMLRRFTWWLAGTIACAIYFFALIVQKRHAGRPTGLLIAGGLISSFFVVMLLLSCHFYIIGH